MEGRANLSLCGVQYKLAEFGIALHNIGSHDIKKGKYLVLKPSTCSLSPKFANSLYD
jgi:hypothetical protein